MEKYGILHEKYVGSLNCWLAHSYVYLIMFDKPPSCPYCDDIHKMSANNDRVDD